MEVKIVQPKLKKILFSLWVCSVLGSLILLLFLGINITEIPYLIETLMAQIGTINAALIFIIIFAIRPLTILPATIFSLASGYIFGPVFGIVLTLVGQTLSGNVAFMFARFFGQDFILGNGANSLKKWDNKLKENAIITVLIMRLLSLPFDAVNYASGLSSMRQVDFLVATIIGVLPGVITFVLLGGSVSPEVSGMLMIFGMEVEQKKFIFALSMITLVVGIIISIFLNKRTTNSSVENAK